MVFTIELETWDETRFRLQQDETWRRLGTDWNLQSMDFRSGNPSTVIENTQGKSSIELEGIVYRIDPQSFNLSEKNIAFYEFSTFRQTFPPIPSKDQLKQIIAAGDDSLDNYLVLNVHGQFELRQPSCSISPMDPTVVVCHEMFWAGNGYVGPDAAVDNEHIDDYYRTSTKEWLIHLDIGNTRGGPDFFTSCTATEIEAELISIEHQWSPQY